MTNQLHPKVQAQLEKEMELDRILTDHISSLNFDELKELAQNIIYECRNPSCEFCNVLKKHLS